MDLDHGTGGHVELPRLTGDGVARLRDALAKAEYTVDSVTGLLGPVASAALNRNETTPGRRATSGGSPLETLTRLWPLQLPVRRAAVETVLPLAELVDGGLLGVDDDTVHAMVDVRPYADEAGDWWVVSDLTPDWTAGLSRSRLTTCSASTPPPRPLPSSRSGGPWSGHSI
jgi:hypothetical protein